jgi:hypothetical protein
MYSVDPRAVIVPVWSMVNERASPKSPKSKKERIMERKRERTYDGVQIFVYEDVSWFKIVVKKLLSVKQRHGNHKL